MNDGSNFIFSDDSSKDIFVLFSGGIGRESLNDSKVFFMNGSFKSRSKQFTQVYTIHANF